MPSAASARHDAHPSAVAATVDVAEAMELATVLKAIADPTRLRLLSIIARSPNGEACVCELTPQVGLRQPTVSHHLKLLVDGGLLTRQKRGAWAWYSLDPARLGEIGRALQAFAAA